MLGQNVVSRNETLLSLQEVAGLLHVHSNTLRRWSDSGKIPSIRINTRGDRRYRKQDISLFLDFYNPWK